MFASTVVLCRHSDSEWNVPTFIKFLYYFSGSVVVVTWAIHFIMAAFFSGTYETISKDNSITSQVLRQIGIVRQLQHYFGAIKRLSQPYTISPHMRRVTCPSTSCPCFFDADRCLRSDAMTNSRL